MRLVQEGRAFFCSELCAKAWKVCQIMQPTEDACSNFLPGNWSTAQQTVKTVDGATLQSEQLIFTSTMFDEEEGYAAKKMFQKLMEQKT